MQDFDDVRSHEGEEEEEDPLEEDQRAGRTRRGLGASVKARGGDESKVTQASMSGA